MPFERCAGLSFTAIAIQNAVPSTSGVYGLSNANEWVYIGVSDDIREALLALLAGRDTYVKSRRPTGFTFEICAPHERAARQDQLVLEFEPFCNRMRDQRHPG